jgi:hypothetical protein
MNKAAASSEKTMYSFPKKTKDQATYVPYVHGLALFVSARHSSSSPRCIPQRARFYVKKTETAV